MGDWPKSDFDVSVTDRQTNTLGFWQITFESPGVRGITRMRRSLRPIVQSAGRSSHVSSLGLHRAMECSPYALI